MFRFFENLIDPYVPYAEKDHPPQTLWSFLWDYSQPFKKVFALSAVMAIVVAAIEIGLIYYMGRLVDVLGSDPAEVWARYGTEFLLVALAVIEGDKTGQLMLLSDQMGKRIGIQPARADNDSLHV